MATRDGSTFALTPSTRVTLSLVATVAGAAYWVVGLSARIDASEYRVARMETEHAQLQQSIIQSLHEQSDQLTSLGIDVAGIEARLALLVEWTDMKRKRANERP